MKKKYPIILSETEREGKLRPYGVKEAKGSMGPEEVVLRRDEEGSRALVEGKPFEQQAFSITEVDPVGAGDAFVAGYLVGHIWELGPKKRLRVANAMSSYSVRPLGAYEGLPDREELEAFLSGEEELGR